MRAYSLDLRKKIVESVKKGVPKAETARRFGGREDAWECFVEIAEEEADYQRAIVEHTAGGTRQPKSDVPVAAGNRDARRNDLLGDTSSGGGG